MKLWAHICFDNLYNPSGTFYGITAEECWSDPEGLTCASLCWLSASPGEISACLASCMSSAEPSITLRAESSIAAAALGSVVEAATPRAACARVFRAWAVSRAAIPAHMSRDFILLVLCPFIWHHNYLLKILNSWKLSTQAALLRTLWG